MQLFRWIEWNLEHIAEHGVDREEAEQLVRAARPPFPSHQDECKWLVQGQGRGGRYLQVIYVIGEDDRLFVIHARPLSEKEIRRLRKRKR